MEKNLMQLFFRETTEEGVYLVCGLVKTFAPITAESQYLIPFEAWQTIPLRNIASISEGKGLDQLMTEPIWKKFA